MSTEFTAEDLKQVLDTYRHHIRADGQLLQISTGQPLLDHLLPFLRELERMHHSLRVTGDREGPRWDQYEVFKTFTQYAVGEFAEERFRIQDGVAILCKHVATQLRV